MKALDVLTRLVIGMGRFGDHLLSRRLSGAIVASLAFACGACLAYALKPAPATKTAAASLASTPSCETAAPPAHVVAAPTHEEEEEWSTPELEAWKNRHGGAPLPLDYYSLPSPPKLSDSKVEVLPSGRTLALAGGDLHMFAADGRVVWTRDTPHDVTSFAYFKATGVIYSKDDGNNLSILDAATGRELRAVPRGGRAFYGAMIPYGEDTCLITDELGSYRVGYTGGDEPTQDGVTAWRGTEMLWHRDVPPDAELQVVGSKIFAVTKTKTSILVKEIKVPRGKR